MELLTKWILHTLIEVLVIDEWTDITDPIFFLTFVTEK